MNPNLPAIELETKPDVHTCMQRIYAWYEGEVLDRAPVRFHRHNEEFESTRLDDRGWGSLEERWFDAEFQVEKYLAELSASRFLGETFPVFWPNLGPDVYASFFGMELSYGETTSWAQPLVTDLSEVRDLAIDWDNKYMKGIERLTEEALKHARGRFLVGYTDLHPGVDCAASLRGNDRLCLDFYDDPDGAERLFDRAIKDFEHVYDHFDTVLKENGQPSVSWMNVPSFGTMHIPSADFSALISPEQFERFCIPVHEREVEHTDHNVFHVDGPGVARHIDPLLELEKIQAFQWVQGVGTDEPIMQWTDLIRRILDHGKSVIISLKLDELESFLDEFNPRGIFLWVSDADETEQLRVLRRLERWS